jgi:hypothetical protein
MGNLTDGMSFEQVESTAVETEMQQQKQEEIAIEDAANMGQNPDGTPIPTQQKPSSSTHIGFFGTLGLSFLAIVNNEIGGSEPETDIKGSQFMKVGNMDDLVIKEIVESGAELDIKYLKGQQSSPEFRYAGAWLLFFTLKGRWNKLKEWVVKKREELVQGKKTSPTDKV